MRVKPADGCLVRDPKSKLALPASGRDVPNTVYWRRRLAAGDVVAIPDSPVIQQNPIPDSSGEEP